MKRALELAAALALAAMASATAARDKDSAAEAHEELRRGGYAMTSNDAEGRRRWEYWWNPKRNDCRLVTLERDRLVSSVLTSETDCGQWREDSRTSDAGRTAIAAARSLRVASLWHRSHERDVRQYQQVDEVAQFERGYRDGRDGRRLDRRRDERAYLDGYRAGERKRRPGTRPEPPVVTPPVMPPVVSPGGPRPPVARPQDLNGRSAQEVEPAMQALGYRRWSGGPTQGGEAVSLWRGPNSPSECVRVWTRANRVLDVLNANEDECTVAPSR